MPGYGNWGRNNSGGCGFILLIILIVSIVLFYLNLPRGYAFTGIVYLLVISFSLFVISEYRRKTWLNIPLTIIVLLSIATLILFLLNLFIPIYWKP